LGNVLSIGTETYTYNSLNELVSSSGPWGSTSYFYDGAGNMLNMTSGSTTTKYGYDSYNRMTSAGSVTLTYDANGNLNKIVNGSNTWKYYYDYKNELTSVTENGATVQSNTYSGDGNRVEQVFGSSSSIVYTYQGTTNILDEKNLTSSTITKNYYANGLLLGEVVGSTPYYLLDDALGSIRDVTIATASSVFSSNYEPYGHTYGLSETLSIFNFEYTHKPYDQATGFYYYGARYYAPSIERFITEDSMQYSMNIQNSLSLNRYIYAEDNPETLNDPDGHMIGFPVHYGNYNDVLQAEEENIDVGTTMTEEAKQQSGESPSASSSSPFEGISGFFSELGNTISSDINNSTPTEKIAVGVGLAAAGVLLMAGSILAGAALIAASDGGAAPIAVLGAYEGFAIGGVLFGAGIALIGLGWQQSGR
jgi:RHS repeat-associated protein